VSDSSEGFAGISRTRLLFIFRRWAPLIVLAAVVSGTAGFAISKVLPSEYRATAQLYVAPAISPTAGIQDVGLGQTLARSYVQLATADVVLRQARESIGWTDSKGFQERTQVAQVRDTSVITVSFLDRDPQRAADIANLIANAFVQQASALQSTLQSATVARLDEDVQTVQADLRGIDAELSQARTDLANLSAGAQAQRAELQARIAQLETNRITKQQTLTQLLTTRDDLRLVAARAQNTVALWESAIPPAGPETPRVALNTAVSTLVGALLAAVGIAMFTYLVDRITDLDEVRERLGVRALGEVPLADPRTLGAHGLFVRDARTSPAAEAIRAVRTSLVFASIDRPPRTIMVTSAFHNEGKSVVSANLALAFAESGSATVLVDADLRVPALHRLYGMDSTVGLTDLLAGTLSLSDISKFEVMPNLIVLPTGRLPLNPAELLSSAKMSSLIASLSRLGDSVTVVVDSSPLLAVADALALATKVDGCVLVVDSARTRARAAQRAVEALTAVHSTVLGVVLNKVPAGQTSYYRGYG
jgi:polysaccharide biosynthesis transport protein